MIRSFGMKFMCSTFTFISIIERCLKEKKKKKLPWSHLKTDLNFTHFPDLLIRQTEDSAVWSPTLLHFLKVHFSYPKTLMISLVLQGNSVAEGLLQVTSLSFPSIFVTIHCGSVISVLNVMQSETLEASLNR